MNPLKLTFTANEQALTKTDNFTDFASNTVSYIEATFTLGENWTGYDSVRAVWKTDYYTISTVLDANFTCVVPTEVLRYKAKVFVNLVGSIVENDTLTDRLTTFPVLALTVKANAAVNGSETAPVTPSQFEQFVDTVRDEAESISDYSYDSEAWAVGTRGGVDVPSTDPTYHNNSKYWAEQSAGLSDDVADLADDVADLKSDLDNISDIVRPKNYIDCRKVVVGNTTNFTINEVSADYIKITHNNQFESGEPYIPFTLPIGSYVVHIDLSASGVNSVGLYEGETWVRNIADGASIELSTQKTYRLYYSPPANSVGILSGVSIIDPNATTELSELEKNVQEIETTIDEITEVISVTETITETSDTAGSVATANGVESVSGSYHTVKFPVNSSDIAHVSVASTNWGNPYYIVCDSNNAVVDVSERSASSATVSALYNFDVTIPNNGSYLIVNYLPTHSVTPTASVTREVLAPKDVSYPFAGKKWVAIGDSLTEKNDSASKNYVDWVCEKLGLSCVNMGVGGTGYMRGYDTNKAFYQRVADIPNDADIITIFGSGNDLGLYNQIGTPSDTGTSTICGCINTTLDYIANNYPTVPVVVIAPTIWKDQIPTSNTPMTYYVQSLEEIAKKRSLHFLNLYSGGGLNPNNAVQLNALFYHQTLDGNADGVHPNNAGHKIIAPKIKNAIECALIAD